MHLSFVQANRLRIMGKWFKILTSFIYNFLSNSTVHGLRYLSHKKHHPLETFSWFFLLASSVYAVSILSTLALRRYTENPTVISMERDRFSWNTSFPAATFCPLKKLDQTRLSDYIASANVTNTTELEDFLIKLSEATFDTFAELPVYQEIAAEDYSKLLLELGFDFNPTVTNSGVENVKGKLQKTLTEMGMCYSFNSQLAVYNSPEYRSNASWELLEEDEIFYVNPLDGDVFVSLKNMSTGVYVRMEP